MADGPLFHPYFAAGSKADIRLLLEEGAKNILVSFAMFQKGLPDDLMRAKRAGRVRVMLDSGGFTNYRKPGTVTVERLIDFIKGHKDSITEYVCLDDIKDRATTVANWRAMKNADLDPILVDHVWHEYTKEYDPEYKTGRKMSWGGLVRTPSGETPQLHGGGSPDSVTARYRPRLDKRIELARANPLTKVHLLGVGQRLRQALRFIDVVDSFDTASWAIGPSLYAKVHWYRKDEDGWPRLILRSPPDLPPEARDYAKARGLNIDKDSIHRQRMSVRQFNKFFEAMEKRIRVALKNKEDLSAVHKALDDDGTPAGETWRRVVYFRDRRAEESGATEKDDAAKVVPAEIASWTPSKITTTDDMLHEMFAEQYGDGKQTAFGGVTRKDVIKGHAYLVREMMRRGLGHEGRSDELDKETKSLDPGAYEQAKKSERPLDLLAVEKADEERYVLSVVLEPTDEEAGFKPDAQKDVYTEGDVRGAFEFFCEQGNQIKLMHEGRDIAAAGLVKVLDNYTTIAEFSLGNRRIRKGTWLMGLRVLDDAVWRDIRSGKLTGYSIGGYGRRVGL